MLLEFYVLVYNYQTFEQFLGGFLLVGKLIQNLSLIQNDVEPYSSLKIFVLNYNSIEDPKMKNKRNYYWRQGHLLLQKFICLKNLLTSDITRKVAYKNQRE